MNIFGEWGTIPGMADRGSTPRRTFFFGVFARRGRRFHGPFQIRHAAAMALLLHRRVHPRAAGLAGAALRS